MANPNQQSGGGSLLSLRNPHSVLAALETRPGDVVEIRLPSSDDPSPGWDRVAQVARELRVRTASGGAGGKESRRGGRDSGAPSDGRVSAAEAKVRAREGVSIEEIVEGAKERGEGRGLWIALDNLQDPHNVGAIFRAAAFFGVQGIFLTQERSAPLTATVYDVACGGLEHVPFALVTNLQRAFEKAKDAGLWLLGTSEHAKENLDTVSRDRPWLLVLGNEEKGMRRLTEETCDVLCKIAPKGPGVTSLNVSVAAGIFIATLSS